MSTELTDLASWANGLKKQKIEAVLPEIEDRIDNIIISYREPGALLEIAESLRPALRLNQTTLAGIASQTDALYYLSLLELDKKLYEEIILLAAQSGHEGLALAIHRNMATLVHAQQVYYQHYLPIPDQEWLRLHRLFYVSEQQKFTDFSVVDRVHYPGKPLSILNQYCIALLFGCARLNHLTPTEMAWVARSLLTWSSLVGISGTPSTESEHQLVVDITSSTAPNFKKLSHPTEKSICYFLQVDQLITKLNSLLPTETIATKPAAFQSPPPAFLAGQKEFSHDAIRHLKSAWSEYIYREERVPVDEIVQVCCGIEAIFYYLCGARLLKDFIGSKVSLSILYEKHEDKTVIEKQRSGDVWSAFLSAPEGNIVSGDIPSEFKFQRHFEDKLSETAPPDHPTCLIQMKDTSSHGCRLHWGKDSGFAAVVGTLIGLRDRNRQSHWQVGEVMWKDVTATGEVITGVRLISSAAIPVAFDVPLRLALNQNYAAGILVPPEESLGSTASHFLTGITGLRQGEYLAISQKGIEEKIQLSRALKASDVGEHYECAFVVKKPSLDVVRPKPR